MQKGGYPRLSLIGLLLIRPMLGYSVWSNNICFKFKIGAYRDAPTRYGINKVLVVTKIDRNLRDTRLPAATRLYKLFITPSIDVSRAHHMGNGRPRML